MADDDSPGTKHLIDVIASGRHASVKLQLKLANHAFWELYRNNNFEYAQGWVEMHQIVQKAFNAAHNDYPKGWNRVGRDSFILATIEKAVLAEFPNIQLATFIHEPLKRTPARWRSLYMEFSDSLMEDLGELPESRREDFVTVWARAIGKIARWKHRAEEDLVAKAEAYFEAWNKRMLKGNYDEGDEMILRLVRARVLYALSDEFVEEPGEQDTDPEDAAVFSGDDIPPKSSDATVSW
jgi:hypothetical protein